MWQLQLRGVMSFRADQLRHVISLTLNEFYPRVNSSSAVELLMLTAANESNLGEYLYQDDGDVDIEPNLAAGAFQIEPKTYLDIVNRVILPKHRSFKVIPHKELITDIKTSIIVARMKYWPFPQPLPNKDDSVGIAHYYKKYYNTSRGKANIRVALQKYYKYCK